MRILIVLSLASLTVGCASTPKSDPFDDALRADQSNRLKELEQKTESLEEQVSKLTQFAKLVVFRHQLEDSLSAISEPKADENGEK
jgi:hypothetical protein